MARKTKAQELAEFSEHVNKLAIGYGLFPTTLVMTQILDLGYDISEERPENVFQIIMLAVTEIQKLWETYGSKPNILVDAKLANVHKSLQGVSPEYQLMFWAGVSNHGVRFKREPAFLTKDIAQYML
ncbi:hypothetical protein D3C87_637280 [compost metagenome]